MQRDSHFILLISDVCLCVKVFFNYPYLKRQFILFSVWLQCNFSLISIYSTNHDHHVIWCCCLFFTDICFLSSSSTLLLLSIIMLMIIMIKQLISLSIQFIMMMMMTMVIPLDEFSLVFRWKFLLDNDLKKILFFFLFAWILYIQKCLFEWMKKIL